MIRAIIILMGLLPFIGHAQNPWLPKGENPWMNYPGNNLPVVSEKESTHVITDSLKEHDQTLPFIKAVDTNDVGYSAVVISEPSQPLVVLDEAMALEAAGDEAMDLYPANGDFGFGFSMGLLFNVFAIPTADVIYMAPDSKNEKKTFERVVNNPEYANADKEKLTKKVKTKIKGRKIGMTIAGSLVGSLTQGLIILVIAAS